MKDKVCLICHTAIDTEKEFFHFKHFKNKDNIKSKAYYHIECFRYKIKGSQIQEELAKRGFDLINLAKKKLGLDQEKEVEII